MAEDDLGMLDELFDEEEEEEEEDEEEEEEEEDGDEEEEEEEDGDEEDGGEEEEEEEEAEDEEEEEVAREGEEEEEEEEEEKTAHASIKKKDSVSSSSAAAAAAATSTVSSHETKTKKSASSSMKKRKRINEDEDKDADTTGGSDPEEEEDPPHDPPAEDFDPNTTPQNPVGYYVADVGTYGIRLVELSDDRCPKTDVAYTTPGPVGGTRLYAIPGDVSVFMGLLQSEGTSKIRHIDGGKFHPMRAKALTGTRSAGLTVMPPRAMVDVLKNVLAQKNTDVDTDLIDSFFEKLSSTDELRVIDKTSMKDFGAPTPTRGPNRRTTGVLPSEKKKMMNNKSKDHGASAGAVDAGNDEDDKEAIPRSTKIARTGDLSSDVAGIITAALVPLVRSAIEQVLREEEE